MTHKISTTYENIFVDLKVNKKNLILAKAELSREIQNNITLRELTQIEAARILKLKQPDVSNLLRGRLYKFSIDRLINLMNLLGYNIEIIIKKIKKEP